MIYNKKIPCELKQKKRKTNEYRLLYLPWSGLMVPLPRRQNNVETCTHEIIHMSLKLSITQDNVNLRGLAITK